MRALTLAAAASLLLTTAASAQGLKDWEEDISSPGRAASVYVWVEGESEAAAWGPFGTKNRSVKPSDPFLLASVSKVYTAVAVVKLAEQARVDLDGPIADYLPDTVVSRMPGLDRITVRQALAMRSGLVEYYTDDNPLAATGGSPDAMLEYVHGERLEFAPNTDYEYSNTNYLLAEILLREVTGKRFGPALDELVFGPGRLRNSEALGYGIGPRDMVMGYSAGALDSVPEFLNYYSGFGFGDGGVVATAEDVAKFYRALLIDRTLLGDWGLRQIISDPEGDQYGLGIEVENDADLGLVYGHSGSDTGYLTDVRLTLDPPAVAVILTAEEDSNTGLTYELLWEYTE